MKGFALAILLLMTAAGCRTPTAVGSAALRERPVVNLPQTLRQHNWTVQGGGSCTWASFVSLLRWQGRYNTADWVRQNCGGGEWPADMAKTLDAANVRYAYTTSGDVTFLEWACRTRRGCGVTIMGGTPWFRLFISTGNGPDFLTTIQLKRFAGFRVNPFLQSGRRRMAGQLLLSTAPRPRFRSKDGLRRCYRCKERKPPSAFGFRERNTAG